jgi:hypothetical protein
MNTRDRTMLTSLMKHGMLQNSPLLNTGELNVISDQSLDPNVVNAESISDTSVVQADEDPDSPLEKRKRVKCPPQMSRAECKKQKKAMKGTCNAHDKRGCKSKKGKTKNYKNKNNSKSKSSEENEKTTKSRPSANFGGGGGNGGGNGGNGGGSGTKGTKGVTPTDGININIKDQKRPDDMYESWT